MSADKPYSLFTDLGQYEDKKLPPVNDWHPETIREIDIRIDRSGRWFHEGTQIHRQPMVRLFSTVLRREGNSYFLVTPVEKCQIEVEDVPFIASLMEIEGEGEDQIIRFITNVGDEVRLDADHQLRVEVDAVTEEPSPYIKVRDNLDALLARSVFYQLTELMVENQSLDPPMLGVWSCGLFFGLLNS